MNIDELIQSAKADVVETPTADHDVVIAGEVVTLRFTKIEPMAWRSLVALFPPRTGVVRDMNLGYNYDLAPSGFPAASVAVVGDDESVTQFEGSQWAELFGTLESPDIFAVSTLLWGLHEYDPAQAVVAAKKARTRGKSTKRRKS